MKSSRSSSPIAPQQLVPEPLLHLRLDRVVVWLVRAVAGGPRCRRYRVEAILDLGVVVGVVWMYPLVRALPFISVRYHSSSPSLPTQTLQFGHLA